MTLAELARLAVEEAARYCCNDAERAALRAARDALDRKAWGEVIRAAIKVVHSAGAEAGKRQQRALQGVKKKPADYRAEIQRLALLREAPKRDVATLARRFSREAESVRRAITRARLRIVRASAGTASASGLRARIV